MTSSPLPFGATLSRSARGITTCLLAFTVSGCTALRPVQAIDAPAPPRTYLDIKVGDRVDVEMKDGRRERFRVASVDAEAVVSPSGQRYARTDMRRLERQRFSHARTWPLVAVGGFLVLVALAGAAGGAGFPQ